MPRAMYETTEAAARFRPGGVGLAPPAFTPPAAACLPESLTASRAGLPWPAPWPTKEAKGLPSLRKTLKLDPAIHYRKCSMNYGGIPASSVHAHSMAKKAVPAPSMRYLDAPVLTSMHSDPLLDQRPTSSASTFTLSSAQAGVLGDAAQRYALRSAHTSAWANAAARSTSPSLSAGDQFLTTTANSYRLRNPADSQQHRLRGFVTAKHTGSMDLHCAPKRCPTAPLPGSSPLHKQSYLGIRAPVRPHAWRTHARTGGEGLLEASARAHDQKRALTSADAPPLSATSAGFRVRDPPPTLPPPPPTLPPTHPAAAAARRTARGASLRSRSTGSPSRCLRARLPTRRTCRTSTRPPSSPRTPSRSTRPSTTACSRRRRRGGRSPRASWASRRARNGPPMCRRQRPSAAPLRRRRWTGSCATTTR